MRQLRPHLRGSRHRMASNGLFPADALPQVWQPPHHAKVPALLYGKRGIQEDMGRNRQQLIFFLMAMTIFSTKLNINEAIKQIYHTIDKQMHMNQTDTRNFLKYKSNIILLWKK